MRDLCIVIATFRRPRLLEKAVLSCINQNNKSNLTFQVIIVDNSPERSAEEVVGRLMTQYPGVISYLSEPRPNISHARNAGVAHCDCPLIAFIDDDEFASPDWLDAMVKVQRDFDADGVFGPVLPTFEAGAPPAWDPDAFFYTRRPKSPSGTRVPFGNTGNVLFRRETCFDEDQSFNPEYGQTGGEDLDFTLRLVKRGRRLVLCTEAAVFEEVPKNRATIQYILRRRFWSGQTFVRCSVRHSDRPHGTAVYWTLVGLGQIGLWLIPAIALAPFRSRYTIKAMVNLFGGLGKVFWPRTFAFNAYRS